MDAEFADDVDVWLADVSPAEVAVTTAPPEVFEVLTVRGLAAG